MRLIWFCSCGVLSHQLQTCMPCSKTRFVFNFPFLLFVGSSCMVRHVYLKVSSMLSNLLFSPCLVIPYCQLREDWFELKGNPHLSSNSMSLISLHFLFQIWSKYLYHILTVLVVCFTEICYVATNSSWIWSSMMFPTIYHYLWCCYLAFLTRHGVSNLLDESLVGLCSKYK
jgi:hypothetical protein